MPKDTYHAIRRELGHVAAAGETITYGNLAAAFGFNIQRSSDRNELARLLGEIGLEEHTRGRPMLCAVVVRQDSGRPGKGFFVIARAWGRLTDEDERDFFAAELRRVHAAWHCREHPPHRDLSGRRLR